MIMCLSIEPLDEVAKKSTFKTVVITKHKTNSKDSEKKSDTKVQVTLDQFKFAKEQ